MLLSPTFHWPKKCHTAKLAINGTGSKILPQGRASNMCEQSITVSFIIILMIYLLLLVSIIQLHAP